MWFDERRHREIVGPGGASGDERRRRCAAVEHFEHARIGDRLAARGEDAVDGEERGPVGEELGADLADERLLQRRHRLRPTQPCRRLERVEAGIREVLHRPHLLHAHAVDLLDLAHEDRDRGGVAQLHRELVDRHAVALLQHVDADDVAVDRTDARRDEAERAGPVGEPDPDQDVERAHPTMVRAKMTRVFQRSEDRAHPYTPRVERLGVLGGTFDPVHIAHIVVAVETRCALDLDRVLLVVAGDPWQKRGRVVASARDRLMLVEAAVADVDGVVASSIEVERDAASVTADTLEALSAPDRELFLILGADAVANMSTWRRLDEHAGSRHDRRRRTPRRRVRRAPGWRVEGRAGGDPAPRHLVDRPA